MEIMSTTHYQSASHQPFDLTVISDGLPAAALVDKLLAASSPAGTGLRGVVVAPPGTGKTTVVPPTIANRLRAADRGGKVLVTQPRRMAARAAARRLAHLTGTRLGETVGYTVRVIVKSLARRSWNLLPPECSCAD